MADTTFTNGVTLTDAAWFQDLNDLFYTRLGSAATKVGIFDAVSVHGADIASAATLNLDAATGDLVDVTGTTSITAITLTEGRSRSVRFTGALTLTNGASLVLPSGANITTAAGDFAIFRGYATGVVRCAAYTKASGASVVVSDSIVQVVEATPVTSVVTCTTAIPSDDTIPQNTEGDQVITVTITPTSSTNRLRIEFDCGLIGGTGSSGSVVCALFQDTTANALAVYASGYTSTAPLRNARMSYEMAAGTTGATTFKVRCGSSGVTLYVNGDAGGSRLFGGVSAARLRVTEIKV